MGVHETTNYELVCDYKGRSWKSNCCEAYSSGHASSERELKRWAEEDGWLVLDDVCFCPKHAKSKQAQEAI